MAEVTQTRITLRALKVKSRASEDTLCYEATVLLDGKPIAQARYDGQSDMTVLHAIEGAEDKLKSAEAFAGTLPPLITNWSHPLDPTRKLEFGPTLAVLVELLAIRLHRDRQLRDQFRRDFARKILYVSHGRVLQLKRVDRMSCTDVEVRRLHSQIRAQHGPETTILSELGPDEAFALWKSCVLNQENAS